MGDRLTLFAAIKAGDLAVVEALLNREASLAKSTENEVSALMVAIYHGQDRIAHEIARRRDEDLDLFEAAAIGDPLRIAAILDESPAALNRLSADGFTALHFGCFFGKKEAVQALIERGADLESVSKNDLAVTALHSALGGGFTEIAKILIHAGARVDVQSGDGWTPLHYASDLGDAEMARHLIQEGAGNGPRNAKGLTAEELADEVGHGHVAEIIRSAKG